MTKIIAILMILGIAVVGLGFYQGWFSAKTKKETTGTEVTLKIDAEKFSKDKETYRAKAEVRLQEFDGQIEKLSAKATDATGEAKIKWEQDVAALKVRKEATTKKLREIQEASAETWEATKTGMEAALNDLKSSFENAAARFK